MKPFKNVEEAAWFYYPTLWNANRINALVKAGKLTQEQADKIMKEPENDSEGT